jgi:hypothetical protein
VADALNRLLTELILRCVTVFKDAENAEIVPVGGGSYYTLSDAGYVTVNGAKAAWADGSIRNACTGDTLISAAGPTDDEPECLTDNDIILAQSGSYTSPDGIGAWLRGGNLWSKPGPYNVVCDGSGTTALLDDASDTVNLINPATGNTYWNGAVPACVSFGSSECVTNSPYPVRMFETPGVVILSAPAVVLAFDKKTGKPLWQKTGQCALAARASPRPEALLGPCTYLTRTDDGDATIISPANGAVVKTLRVGNYDQWTANVSRLLAVETPTGKFREMSW